MKKIIFFFLFFYSCSSDSEDIGVSDSSIKCKDEVKFEFHNFSNIEIENNVMVGGIKEILSNIDLKSTKLKVPIHYIFYPSSGLSASQANAAATKIASRQFPGSDSSSNEKYKFVYDDLYSKLQKEAITADLPLGSCGGSVTIALPPKDQSLDFDNYYGKVSLHEYHHIFQNTPLHNNPSGNKKYVYTWMTEGTAEYWALTKFTEFGYSLSTKDIVSQVSEIKSKLKEDTIIMDGKSYKMAQYRKMSLYDDEFGDSFPIHSTEIGLVITHYMITVKNKKLEDIIKLYETGTSVGREKALEDFLGISYNNFETEFEIWIKD